MKGIILSKDTQTVFLRGTTMYAKILGDPVLNYSKDGKEWKMDLVIDKNDIKELKSYGIADRVKTKDGYADDKPYISFKQREMRTVNGEEVPNDPIRVVDAAGKPWDSNKLLGNGSTVDVKFVVKDWGAGKKKGVYIRAVRVLDHVSFDREEFAPLDETDAFFKESVAPDFKADFGLSDLDDDLPM